jgi:hypothetical protein
MEKPVGKSERKVAFGLEIERICAVCRSKEAVISFLYLKLLQISVTGKKGTI